MSVSILLMLITFFRAVLHHPVCGLCYAKLFLYVCRVLQCVYVCVLVSLDFYSEMSVISYFKYKKLGRRFLGTCLDT